jgi:hypothetical protein
MNLGHTSELQNIMFCQEIQTRDLDHQKERLSSQQCVQRMWLFSEQLMEFSHLHLKELTRDMAFASTSLFCSQGPYISLP